MESHSAHIFRKLPDTGRRYFLQYLPTATQYAGMQFLQECCRSILKNNFPLQWKNDDEEGGKNLNEEEFFKAQLKTIRKGRSESIPIQRS